MKKSNKIKKSVVRDILINKLLERNKMYNSNTKIKKNFKATDKLIIDVLFQDLKVKEAKGYKIYSKHTNKILNQIKEEFKKVEFYNFNFNYVLININDLSDSITELTEQLDKYI